MRVGDVVELTRGLPGFVGCRGKVIAITGDVVDAMIEKAIAAGHTEPGTWHYVAHRDQFRVVQPSAEADNKGVT